MLSDKIEQEGASYEKRESVTPEQEQALARMEREIDLRKSYEQLNLEDLKGLLQETAPGSSEEEQELKIGQEILERKEEEGERRKDVLRAIIEEAAERTGSSKTERERALYEKVLQRSQEELKKLEELLPEKKEGVAEKTLSRFKAGEEVLIKKLKVEEGEASAIKIGDVELGNLARDIVENQQITVRGEKSGGGAETSPIKEIKVVGPNTLEIRTQTSIYRVERLEPISQDRKEGLTVENSENFSELYKAIQKLETIKGSEQDYSSRELINIIESVRERFKASLAMEPELKQKVLRAVTRSEGLRDKVEELIEQETERGIKVQKNREFYKQLELKDLRIHIKNAEKDAKNKKQGWATTTEDFDNYIDLTLAKEVLTERESEGD